MLVAACVSEDNGQAFHTPLFSDVDVRGAALYYIGEGWGKRKKEETTMI